MADDEAKVGGPDCRRVAGDQGYEVRHFADKHGISSEEGRKLIDRFGDDREKLDSAAAELNRKGRRGSDSI